MISLYLNVSKDRVVFNLVYVTQSVLYKIDTYRILNEWSLFIETTKQAV